MKNIGKCIPTLCIIIGLISLNAATQKTNITMKKEQQKKTHHRPVKRIGYYPISPATQAAINSMRPHIQQKLVQRKSLPNIDHEK